MFAMRTADDINYSSSTYFRYFLVFLEEFSATFQDYIVSWSVDENKLVVR